MEDEDAEVFFIDAGDNIDLSHPLTYVTRGKFNIDMLNFLNVDFFTIGNNEGIGLKKEELLGLFSRAKFKVVISNLNNLSETENVKRHFILETRKGTKIAILSYTILILILMHII